MTRRLQFDEDAGPEGEERDIIGVTVHVFDESTGDEWIAPPESCSLRLDCSKINRTNLRPGHACDKRGGAGSERGMPIHKVR